MSAAREEGHGEQALDRDRSMTYLREIAHTNARMEPGVRGAARRPLQVEGGQAAAGQRCQEADFTGFQDTSNGGQRRANLRH